MIEKILHCSSFSHPNHPSVNYVISEEVCELQNRTKEARPENFVPNFERYYVRSNKKRGEIEREAALVLVFIEVIWTW